MSAELDHGHVADDMADFHAVPVGQKRIGQIKSESETAGRTYQQARRDSYGLFKCSSLMLTKQNTLICV
jgi:hypothetical protein